MWFYKEYSTNPNKFDTNDILKHNAWTKGWKINLIEIFQKNTMYAWDFLYDYSGISYDAKSEVIAHLCCSYNIIHPQNDSLKYLFESIQESDSDKSIQTILTSLYKDIDKYKDIFKHYIQLHNIELSTSHECKDYIYKVKQLPENKSL